MGSVKEYFSNLGSGIASLVKGMQVTGKEFVTPKITEEYPDNRDNLPVADRFRAILTLKYDDQGDHKCIACGTCERVCPNNTISLDIKTVETWDGKKKKKLDKYHYDLGSCTFCQLCVTNCPTDALEFSNDFEQAVFTRGKLLRKLNYLPEKEEPQPTPEEIARMKAEKEAKIAAAKAPQKPRKQPQPQSPPLTLLQRQLPPRRPTMPLPRLSLLQPAILRRKPKSVLLSKRPLPSRPNVRPVTPINS